MRILKSRSQKEVSSNGFALFVVGLIVAGFFGGAFRTLLSSQQIQSRILQQLEASLPEFSLRMDAAKVSLARGIWPGLTIDVPRLEMTKPATCGDPVSSIRLENIRIPIGTWSVLRRKPRIATARIAGGTILLDFSGCEKKQTARSATSPQPLPSESSNTAVTSPRINGLREILKKALGSLREKMDGLAIQSLKVQGAAGWTATLKSLNFNVADTDTLSTRVSVDKGFKHGHLSQTFQVHLKIAGDQLDWRVETRLKEGVVHWSGVGDLISKSVRQELRLDQVPVRDMLNDLYVGGLLPSEAQPRLLWLTCELDHEGVWPEWKTLPIKITNCRLEGEGGQIIIAKQEAWPWEKDFFKSPVVAQVNNVSLRMILDLIDRAGLPAVIPELGRWTGTVEFLNKNNWSIQGLLSGMEIVFSNKSVRGKQRIASLSTYLQASGGRIRGTFSKMGLADGSSHGQFDADFDDRLLNGRITVHMPELSLSPAIQKLMFQSISSPLDIEGVARIRDGDLASWNGTAKWDKTQGDGWSGRGGVLKTHFANGVFTGNLAAQNLHLESSSVFASLLPRLFSGPVTWPAEFRSLHADFSVNGRLRTVKRMSAVRADGPTLSLSGRWQRGELFDGILKVSGRSKHWTLTGRDGDWSLQ